MVGPSDERHEPATRSRPPRRCSPGAAALAPRARRTARRPAAAPPALGRPGSRSGCCSACWRRARRAPRRVQARLLAALNERLSFSLVPGPSARFVAPRHGPYDDRLGYVQLPEWTARLEREGFAVREQARALADPRPRWPRSASRRPTTRRPARGLSVLDRSGSAGVPGDASPPRGYAALRRHPAARARDAAVRREPRAARTRSRAATPPIEWDRFARAALLQLGGRRRRRPRPGRQHARHADREVPPFARAAARRGPLEKLRQIGSASLRAYRDGEDTRAARRAILLDYLNSLPLAAAAGRGEVLGLAAGLEAWYGADFDRTNELLAAPVDARDRGGSRRAGGRLSPGALAAARDAPPERLPARAPRGARRAGRPPPAPASPSEGVIPVALRDAALARAPAARRRRPRSCSRDAGPAEPVRRWLVGALALPDYYALDRLDLSVTSTLDGDLQAAGRSAASRRSRDPAVVAAAGLRAKGLLESADPARVIYSFALYERVGRHEPAARAGRQLRRRARRERRREARPRLDRQAARARELPRGDRRASTQKLAGSEPRRARGAAANGPDPLTRFVAETLAAKPDDDLDATARGRARAPLLGEPLAGLLHRRRPPLLPQLRQGRRAQDPVGAHGLPRLGEPALRAADARRRRLQMARLPGNPAAMLQRPQATRAARSGCAARRRRRPAPSSRASTARTPARAPRPRSTAGCARAHPTPRRLAVALRSVFPERSFEDFAAALRALPAGAALGEPDLRAMYGKYGRERFSLADRAFLARMHPLELWLMEWQREHPAGTLRGRVGRERRRARHRLHLAVPDAQPRRPGPAPAHAARARRLRAHPPRVEEARLPVRDARALRRHRDRQLGRPPLGAGRADGHHRGRRHAAADRARDGAALRAPARPTRRRSRRRPRPREQVLRPEVARALRERAARRGRERHRPPRERRLRATPLGGKTGTGDHQKKRVDRWANVIDSEYVSRTATFVFFAGDRFHGVITAHVAGPESARLHLHELAARAGAEEPRAGARAGVRRGARRRHDRGEPLDPALAPGPVAVAQAPHVELAGRRARQRRLEVDRARRLVGGEPRAREGEQLGRERGRRLRSPAPARRPPSPARPTRRRGCRTRATSPTAGCACEHAPRSRPGRCSRRPR